MIRTGIDALRSAQLDFLVSVRTHAPYSVMERHTVRPTTALTPHASAPRR